jgi:predicted small integral membrane protein
MTLAWMAWTPPTALFFLSVFAILLAMGVWHRLRPANPMRTGLLGLGLQRGDRLFLSLLGSAFIHLAWIALAPETAPLFVATLLSAIYAGLVFRFA